MDKEHIKGAIDNVVGKTEEAIGRAVGNTKLEAEGKADQIKASLHNTAGDIKDAGKEAIDHAKTAVNKY
jgi:uncharacterized protein YjbJ (UPF0337 family)